MDQFSERKEPKDDGGLMTPMGSRPYNHESRGGSMPGMKDGIALGAPKTDLSTPMSSRPEPMNTTAAPAGPVTMQVTEDVQGIEGARNKFPSGTGTRM